MCAITQESQSTRQSGSNFNVGNSDSTHSIVSPSSKAASGTNANTNKLATPDPKLDKIASRRSYATPEGRTIKLTLPLSASGGQLISPTSVKFQQHKQQTASVLGSNRKEISPKNTATSATGTASGTALMKSTVLQLRKEAMSVLISFQSFQKVRTIAKPSGL